MAASSANSPFSLSPSFMNNSFSDLLNSPSAVAPGDDSTLLNGSVNRGAPKFKSLHPPSLLPVSPTPASPSSYFAFPPGLSPSELLDSPVLLTSSYLLPSPTTGSFPAAQPHNWRSLSVSGQHDVKPEDSRNQNNTSSYSDFTFQPELRTVSQPWNFKSYQSQQKTDSISNERVSGDYSSYQPAPIQSVREARRSDDGYNWRKYGQKQVKGSENPRSYYKCTFPGCPTKKKVERSLDGDITEIVYKGSHNHAKPQSTRRSASNGSHPMQHVNGELQAQEHSVGSQMVANQLSDHSAATPENSSVSVGDDDRSSSRRVGDDKLDDDEPDPKRWKRENEGEIMSAPGCRAVREPRVVVQTTSDIDILDDGYRWRKYGQKVVKGNPNPRSYYKCTNPGCPVRKHVERASHDLRAVITTYEGKHNHDVPAARGSGSHSRQAAANNSCVTNSTHHQSSTGQPAAAQQAPFTLEMLHGPESFGFGNPVSAYNNVNGRQQNPDCSVFPRTKEEPREDQFLESICYAD
uniref:WRKY domain-containing protein n=1 Tax=Kalanchoe fedtschenkoi TaxID=63787 RepID=A0A7N0TGU5_KALFE